MNRVAIIGAGPSGLATICAFKQAQDKGEKIPEVVCFEKQSNFGGLWNYTWRTGVDENGEPCHGSMYKYLWSNGPKECLEFPAYTFEEHFGQNIGSYPPRPVLESYIRGRFAKEGTAEWIRLNTVIRNCTFSDETKLFSVTALDIVNQKTYTEEFEHVIVASGHFSTPNMPEIEGIQSFPGRVMHSHDFRNANEFKDRNVLVVGGSYSAEDIGLQCYKYGAKSVTSCYRSAPIGFNWPEGYTEKQNIVRLDGKTAYFKDGTTNELDAIILCTGYKHNYPFLEDKLRLSAKNTFWIEGLWKGIFWEKNTKLLYLSMQDQFYTFNMFDAQAWYARDAIMGKIKVPTDAAEQEVDNLKWRTKHDALKGAHDQIAFQGEQIDDWTHATDYPNMDIAALNQLFYDWEDLKQKDILHYRDGVHKSVFTGRLSVVHKQDWLKS